MQELTLIGVDFGLKNIGLAVGQTLTSTASALKTIKYRKPFNYTELDVVIKQWQPDKIIMGLPLTEDGEPQKISKIVEAFAQQLTQRYQIPIEFMDERYSSMEAQAEFASARASGMVKRKGAQNLDSLAARTILQRWLDQNH